MPTFAVQFLSDPSSCLNHALYIAMDVLLLVMLLFNVTQKSSSKFVHNHARFQGFSKLQMLSVSFNGCLGLVYLCLGTLDVGREAEEGPHFFPCKLVVANTISRIPMVASSFDR